MLMLKPSCCQRGLRWFHVIFKKEFSFGWSWKDGKTVLYRPGEFGKLFDNSFQNMSICKRTVSVASNYPCVFQGKSVKTRCGHFRAKRQNSSNAVAIESQLIKHMDMWEMEKAVSLLRDAVNSGQIPNQTVVLNLLQQLANLAETECLLDLHDFLRERNLVTDTKFFKSLQDAYHNSGRIDEGVAVLRILYHRTRKYRDVEPFFCLLASMVIEHFRDKVHLVEQFVTDLRNFEEPVLEPIASLWKCYVLKEEFETAEEFLRNNKEELSPYLPNMVSDICGRINKIDANYDAVFGYLLRASFVKQKQKNLMYVLHAEALCDKAEYESAIRTLCESMDQEMRMHWPRLELVLQKLDQHTPPERRSRSDTRLVQQYGHTIKHVVPNVEFRKAATSLYPKILVLLICLYRFARNNNMKL